MCESSNKPYTPIAFARNSLWIWARLTPLHANYEGFHEAFAVYPGDLPDDGTIQVLERCATPRDLAYPPFLAPLPGYMRVDLKTMEFL